jgi:hypothetical protein
MVTFKRDCPSGADVCATEALLAVEACNELGAVYF